MKRWVWIACMYTLYTPRCFAISQVEANIKQSSGLMRALTRPNGHAGVNTLEATLHCNAKGVAVSGYHIYTCSTNSISVENFILSQYTYILQWICTYMQNEQDKISQIPQPQTTYDYIRSTCLLIYFARLVWALLL